MTHRLHHQRRTVTLVSVGTRTIAESGGDASYNPAPQNEQFHHRQVT
jgi:hypothetical protein